MVKIHIDRANCINCGACESACSEVFMLDEESIASINQKYRTTDAGTGFVDDNLEQCVDKAVESCPVSVITKD